MWNRLGLLKRCNQHGKLENEHETLQGVDVDAISPRFGCSNTITQSLGPHDNKEEVKIVAMGPTCQFTSVVSASPLVNRGVPDSHRRARITDRCPVAPCSDAGKGRQYDVIPSTVTQPDRKDVCPSGAFILPTGPRRQLSAPSRHNDQRDPIGSSEVF